MFYKWLKIFRKKKSERMLMKKPLESYKEEKEEENKI